MTERNSSNTVCQVSEQKELRSSHILHAVEAAEKKVIGAVRNEVDILFNDKDHPQVRHVSTRSTRTGGRRRKLQSRGTNITDRNRFGWGLDQSFNI